MECSVRGPLTLEGSKDSIVKGLSFSQTSNWMVTAIIDQEFVQRSWNWYTRVPSPSNPSDEASRLNTEKLESEGAFKRVRFRQPCSVKRGRVIYSASRIPPRSQGQLDGQFPFTWLECWEPIPLVRCAIPLHLNLF